MLSHLFSIFRRQTRTAAPLTSHNQSRSDLLTLSLTRSSSSVLTDAHPTSQEVLRDGFAASGSNTLDPQRNPDEDGYYAPIGSLAEPREHIEAYFRTVNSENYVQHQIGGSPAGLPRTYGGSYINVTKSTSIPVSKPTTFTVIKFAVTSAISSCRAIFGYHFGYFRITAYEFWVKLRSQSLISHGVSVNRIVSTENFIFGRPLGNGSQGFVWNVTFEKKPMAVKIFTADSRNTNNDEIEYLKCINHNNIVKIQATVIDNTGQICGYLMPLYKYTLSAALNPSENIQFVVDEKKKVSRIKDLARAVSYLHNEKIIVRDINPKNIMITKEGVLVLIDLGSSRKLVSTMTRCVGTFPHIAPECLVGDENGNVITYDEKADSYSYGTVVYFIFTGREMHMEEFEKHSNNDSDYLNAIKEKSLQNSFLDEIKFPFIKDLLQKCLAFKPEHRSTMHEIFDRFQDSNEHASFCQSFKMPTLNQDAPYWRTNLVFHL